jgi:Putative Ig domain
LKPRAFAFILSYLSLIGLIGCGGVSKTAAASPVAATTSTPPATQTPAATPVSTNPTPSPTPTTTPPTTPPGGGSTPSAPLAVSISTLPAATAGTAYSVTLAASGGTQPYSWTIGGGTLPAGLNLSSSGAISGTTTITGTYPVTLTVTDYTGAAASANLSLVVAAPQSSSGFTRFYADNSFWNTPIPANPQIDGNSAAMISTAIVAYSSSANFANSDDWGIALSFANGSSKTYTVQCTMFCSGDTITFPIPAGAQPTTGSDHHLAVVNGKQELDMWLAAYNAGADTWSAGTRTVADITGWGAACLQGQHCNGAVAAGFDLLGGSVRPEEIAQGHIDHALSITSPATRSGYIACPATHTDGATNSSSAIPEGARIQLDPNFNVDAQSWPAWEKIVAKALQNYGAYVSDTSGSLAIRGVADMNLGSKNWAWANTPKGPSLTNLPWSQFRVLQIQSCN